MEDLAVFTALNHSGYFGKKLKKKFICWLGGPYGEKLRPRSQFFTIRTFQPANNIYIGTNFESVRNSQGSKAFELAAAYLQLKIGMKERNNN